MTARPLHTSTLEGLLERCVPGAVWVYPTDTVVGVGCRATDTLAVQRLRHLKARPEAQGLLVLVHDWNVIRPWVTEEVLPHWHRLTATATTPTTWVVPANHHAPPGLCSETGSLAIRRPQHDAALALCARLGEPLVSTSANPRGGQPTTEVNALDAAWLTQVDAVWTERCGGAAPSRLVDLLTGEVYRA